MMEPTGPVLLFDEDGRLFILSDPALVSDLIDTADEFFEGYDGHGHPLRAHGAPGSVELALITKEVHEERVRKRVERYYSVFAARHPTRVPPQKADLSAFIEAVAADLIEE
ncbi:hypothetical protein ACFC34_00175 [Streptomyces sp. NPDC056053]|uniref:hypothetical protein n=1 Tax=Streptomyces sp. NPDC056053 TaxID=3345696 RepID=UPI0035D8D4BC